MHKDQNITKNANICKKNYQLPNCKQMFDFLDICCPGTVFSLQKGRTKVQEMVKRHMWSPCQTAGGLSPVY